MNKKEFIKELRTKTNHLSPIEQNRIIEYYTEIIDDKLENNENEENIIKGLGTINEIIEKMKVDKPQNNNKILRITLLIFCSPILLGLYITGYALLFSLWITVAAFIFSSFLITLTLIPYLISILIYMMGTPFVALYQFGICIAMLGLAILLVIACYYMSIGAKKFNHFLRNSLLRIGKEFL